MDNDNFPNQPGINTNNKGAESNLSTKPKTSKKRRNLIGIIIAAVVILLGIGTVLVYSLWYQNPEKIVFDSISNAIKAKSMKATGEFDVAFSEGNDQGIDNIKLSLTENGDLSSFDLGAELTVNLTDIEKPLILNGKAILDNEGNVYFNVSNIEDAVDKFITFSNHNCITSYAEYYDNEEDLMMDCDAYSNLEESLEPIIDTVDDQWWKVSADDLSELSEDWAEEQKCLTGIVKKINDDKKIHDEIIDLYKKNPFISINKELGVNNGSYGFEIGLDSKLATGFINNIDETTLYKEINKCSDSFEIGDEIDEDDISGYSDFAKDNGTLVLWVSQFGHEISQIEANYKNDEYKLSANISPVFNKPFELEIPSNSKSVSELIEAIQESTDSFSY